MTAPSIQNFHPMAHFSIREELANSEYELIKNQATHLISMVAFAAIAIGAIYFAATISTYHVLPVLASVSFAFSEAFLPFIYDPFTKEHEEKSLQCHLLKQVDIPPYNTREEKIQALTKMIGVGAHNYYDLPVKQQDTLEKGLFNIYSHYLMAEKAIEECNNKIALQEECLATRQAELEAEIPMTAEEYTKVRKELTEIKARIAWLEEYDNPYASTMGLAKAKMTAAYCKFVLQNPTTQRNLEDFGEMTPRSLFYRRSFEDNTYLVRTGGEEINRDFFLENSVDTIRRRIFN